MSQLSSQSFEIKRYNKEQVKWAKRKQRWEELKKVKKVVDKSKVSV